MKADPVDASLWQNTPFGILLTEKGRALAFTVGVCLSKAEASVLYSLHTTGGRGVVSSPPSSLVDNGYIKQVEGLTDVFVLTQKGKDEVRLGVNEQNHLLARCRRAHGGEK